MLIISERDKSPTMRCSREEGWACYLRTGGELVSERRRGTDVVRVGNACLKVSFFFMK